METQEEMLKRITTPKGIMFSRLTQDEREQMLKTSAHNLELFKIYIEYRNRTDEYIRNKVMNGEDVLANEAEANAMFDYALNGRDINEVGEACSNAHTVSRGNLTALATEAARRMLGSEGAKAANPLIEALLRSNGIGM